MEKIAQRSYDLFQAQMDAIYRRTDRSFAILMMLQWFGAIATAYLISPRTWEGASSSVHLHIWAALFLGGAITLFPVSLALLYPGHASTRHVIALGQVLMSSLLIHLTGGRIETHFHIFGSLAFLSFYRDWRVLVSATAVIAVDHFLRGVYWPQSVYGVLSATPWRAVEHAFWVVFENIFLIIAILQSLREMQGIASRQATLEDLNERIEDKVKERTEQLEQSQKRMRLAEKMSAVGQLAGGIAHEINNPLGVIIGFAEGVLRRINKDDILHMPLESIQREALRCKTLVQDLLTFSRASKIEREPMDINQAVEGALSLVQAKAKMTRVKIHKDLASALPQAFGNPNQVQQVIINLATNAIDAMDGQGTLTFKTELLCEGPLSWICLRVSDTGSGIPQDVLPHIFEPFYTTKATGQGTGLGLALVHEIITKHSGSINVESRTGHTEFCVKFPVRTGREGSETDAAKNGEVIYASQKNGG